MTLLVKAVCCVTLNTCISRHGGMVSSNLDYYEGGCQSFQSSKKTYNETLYGNGACVQQGECMVQYTQVCKGGTTKSGQKEELPKGHDGSTHGGQLRSRVWGLQP